MIIYLALLFIPIGIIFGIILAKKIPEEIKPGKKYFKLFEILLLTIIFLISLKEINYILLFIGVIIGYFFTKEYFYFGLLNLSSLIISLVFIYGLPFGTINLNNKKEIIRNIILFFIAILSLFIDYNFLSFAIGGLGSIIIKKIIRFK
ncbi:hypothetical protein J4436_02390 [Candidatus Woesearchaeota archaeon]|nr:hypothetical protein [Candidatus Woesearchaeota archaeon]